MALKTTTEQLEDVQDAIEAVMSNQEYELGDRRIRRARLDMLQAREDKLRRRLAKENGTRPGAMGVTFNGLGYD